MFLLGEDKCYEVELKLYGYAPHCQFYTSRVEKEGKKRRHFWEPKSLGSRGNVIAKPKCKGIHEKQHQEWRQKPNLTQPGKSQPAQMWTDQQIDVSRV